jgi:hypothetical protein
VITNRTVSDRYGGDWMILYPKNARKAHVDLILSVWVSPFRRFDAEAIKSSYRAVKKVLVGVEKPGYQHQQ